METATSRWIVQVWLSATVWQLDSSLRSQRLLGDSSKLWPSWLSSERYSAAFRPQLSYLVCLRDSHRPLWTSYARRQRFRGSFRSLGTSFQLWPVSSAFTGWVVFPDENAGWNRGRHYLAHDKCVGVTKMRNVCCRSLQIMLTASISGLSAASIRCFCECYAGFHSLKLEDNLRHQRHLCSIDRIMRFKSRVRIKVSREK